MTRFIFTLFILSLSTFTDSSKADTATESLLASSKTFLENLNSMHENSVPFDSNEALAQAEKLKPYILDEARPKETRSKMMGIYAGIIGIYASQEKSAAKGKEAYQYTKKALSTDPCNETAAIAFARTLFGIDSSNWSWFAKRSLGISGSKFVSEIDYALKHLNLHLRLEEVQEMKRKLEAIR